MRPRPGVVVLLFAALVPMAAGTACGRGGHMSRSADRTVLVHGAATISTKPDRVAFTAGVETRDASAPAAFRANSARVQAVLAALKARGVAERQMQTSYLDVGTIPPRGNTPRSFKVSNQVTVTREDPAEVGDLIQAVVGAGANDIGGLRFFVADASAFQQDGLQQAFKDARAKAEVLARESGATLGPIVSMSDQTVYAEDDLRKNLSSLGYIGGRVVEPGTEQMHFAVTAVFALR